MPVHKSNDKPISAAQLKANETKARKKAEAEAAAAAGASNPVEKPEAPAAVKPATEQGQGDSGKAGVITELVKQGYSYDQAVAMVNGGGAAAPAPAPRQAAQHGDQPFDIRRADAATRKLIDGDDSHLPPVEDAPEKELEHVEVSFELRDGFENYLFDLEARILELREDRDKDKVYVLPIPFTRKLYEFLLADTLREGVQRRDPNFTEARMVEIIFKQRLATDPTKGGTVRPSSSGPKGSYNATSGGWDG